MHDRLSLPLTMYPEGQEQVPPSGEVWQWCSQLKDAHFQIPDQWRNQSMGGFSTVAQSKRLQYMCTLHDVIIFGIALTAVASSSGVCFVLSLRAVCLPITQFIHGNTQTWGRTGPFPWVTLPWYVAWTQDKLIIFSKTDGWGCKNLDKVTIRVMHVLLKC